MKTKRVNRTYSQEFKQEAVALVVEQGYSVAEAGRSLGVNANLIYKWREVIEAQANGNQLRADNKRLRQEKEILKKASAFFAREMS